MRINYTLTGFDPCVKFILDINCKQEHQKGNIVEPQVLHQDGLNYLCYNGLKTPIIIAHVYESFQVEVVSNITQNHSINPYKVMSHNYLPQFTCTVEIW